MRVRLTLPQDAVPEENPHRVAEMAGAPRVGDLIDYSDVAHRLVVTSVAWYINRTDAPADVAEGPDVVCDWHYVGGEA
ncbi:hypothetical protein [Mycolicibacterium setense]